MTEYTRGQQADVVELAHGAIKMCEGWQANLRTMADQCRDADVAEICRDNADHFKLTTQRINEMISNGTSAEEIHDAVNRASVCVLGRGKEYTREAVMAFGQMMARIFDVEPWAREADDD